jgi:hypothetical protein
LRMILSPSAFHATFGLTVASFTIQTLYPTHLPYLPCFSLFELLSTTKLTFVFSPSSTRDEGKKIHTFRRLAPSLPLVHGSLDTTEPLALTAKKPRD